MVGALARAALTLLLAASLAGTFWSALRLSRNPALAPVIARSATEIRAAVARETARAATPERLATRLRALLAETPRNWLAIDALSGIAGERHIALPPDLIAARDAARARDTSLISRAGTCLACAWNAENCPLSALLICQAPMVVTPLGDVMGLGNEAWHAAAGAPVDRINLALSVVGLGGTLLAIPSEGAGAALGLGANVARMAHRMGLMTRPMGALILRAARDGIDWAGLRRLPLAEFADAAHLRRLLRPRAFAPVVETAQDLGRIEEAAGPLATLHLIRYIDSPEDARLLADAGEALGPKLTGRLELLGKSRLVSLTTRFTRFAAGVVISLAGLIYSLGMMLAHGLHHAALSRLRRAARRPAPPPRFR
jgi:hypothetical protein